jgi:hypothetical protein
MKSYRNFWLGVLGTFALAQATLIGVALTDGGFLEFLANYGESASEDPLSWRFLFYPFFSLVTVAGLIGLVWFCIRGKVRAAKISLILAGGLVFHAFIVWNVLGFVLADEWELRSIRIPFISIANSWDLIFSEFGPYWSIINLELSIIFYGIFLWLTFTLFPRPKTSSEQKVRCFGCQSEIPISLAFCTNCGKKTSDVSIRSDQL